LNKAVREMTKRGRKSKLTPELIKQAAQLLSAGNYVNVVCQYLGIHESTWYKWLAEGEESPSGLKREFCEAVKEASAGSEIRAITGILSAGKHSWQALAWFLERRYPDRWGR
jgi:hypothetical protein